MSYCSEEDARPVHADAAESSRAGATPPPLPRESWLRGCDASTVSAGERIQQEPEQILIERPPPNDSAARRLTTTTELLDALRRGPQASAWSGFVDRYTPVLRGVASKLGLGPDDAEDVAQQTLMEFIRDFGRGSFDRRKARLRTWLLAILRHRVSDLRRLRARDAAVLGIQPIPDAPGDEVLDSLWQRQIERRRLEEGLAAIRTESKLSAKSLLAFELTVLRGVPHEAAAVECGMTVNAVYIAKGRVLRRLESLVAALDLAFSEDLS